MTVGFYLLQRLLYTVPLLLGAVTIVFVLVHLAPGNPVDYIIGESGADKEMIARLTADMGLDRPLYIQLLRYLGQVATGNLGYSFVSSTPVLELILDRLPATLLLMASQLVFSISLGITLGVLSARRPNSLLDNTITVFSLASFAIPVFWLGQLLILGFGYYLDWLPIQGMVNLRAGYTGFDHVLDVARHMILPVATLTLYNLALILRLTRGSLLEVVGQEYIKVARSKGLSENTVMVKHALRNALLPAGPRPPDLRRHQCARLSAAHGDVHLHLPAGGDREPRDRPALCPPRSPHPLSIGKGRPPWCPHESARPARSGCASGARRRPCSDWLARCCSSPSHCSRRCWRLTT